MKTLVGLTALLVGATLVSYFEFGDLHGGWILVATIKLASLVWRWAPARDDDEVDWNPAWLRADLSKVPYVITQPEARGSLLPWYRRIFARRTVEERERPLTTYRS